MAVTTEIQPGVVLADRFRVRGRLGEGGSATVFLAEDCVLCRDVAIKRLHAEGSEADIRRFRREARLGASLLHPNLVTVFDTLSGPDGLLIVMEYVRGRPLLDLIGPEGMDPKRLLQILRPVASALDYAHQHGVVHRDVKPANILIAEDRRVKVVDLGTATAGHLTQITAENEVTGTLSYMAPERLAGESVGEPAADVYSLAVVAFEALTGRKAHRAETPGELLDQILHDPPPDVLESWPQAPPGLGPVLMQAMDPDPDRRHASPSAFVRDLEAALADRAETARPPLLAPTEPMRASTRERPASLPPLPPPLSVRGGAEPGPRRRWLLPALGCIAAVLAVGAWLFLSAGGSEKSNGPAAGSRAAAGHGAAAGNAGARGGQPAHHGQARASSATSAASTAAGATTPAPTGSLASSSVPDPAAGTRLNDEGYALIQQGRYAEAVPLLRRAVASFPQGTTDINYAYALFNLGHALRMVGRPQEAIPILEQRLRIPDQTETVQAELDAARAAAGR